ncbi:hypothetical protein N7528_009401 [Penicillium herquei]|nr:hypothetical protein N7528_009401 [Penicillium herquei]
MQWVLVNDDAVALTEYRNKNHSFVNLVVTDDPSYPDPFLEIGFDCAYNLPLPPKDDEDEHYKGADTIDERVDKDGLRCSQYGYGAYTSQNVESLRVITIEQPNDDNLGLSQAIAVGDRVVLSKEQLNGILPDAYGNGPVQILQIKVKDGTTPLVAGMHLSEDLGEKTSKWAQITQHVTNSRTINLLKAIDKQTVDAIVRQMNTSWERMRAGSAPLGSFFGNNPGKPFQVGKSGSADEIVPIEDRPANFQARTRIAFLHKAEYNASLGSAYIDECDHKTTTNLTERSLVISANHELCTRQSNEANGLRELLLM